MNYSIANNENSSNDFGLAMDAELLDMHLLWKIPGYATVMTWKSKMICNTVNIYLISE